jgi:hypothetical protein
VPDTVGLRSFFPFILSPNKLPFFSPQKPSLLYPYPLRGISIPLLKSRLGTDIIGYVVNYGVFSPLFPVVTVGAVSASVFVCVRVCEGRALFVGQYFQYSNFSRCSPLSMEGERLPKLEQQ